MIDLRKLKIKGLRLYKYIPFKKNEAAYKIYEDNNYGYVIDIEKEELKYSIVITLYDLGRKEEEEVNYSNRVIKAKTIKDIAKEVENMMKEF